MLKCKNKRIIFWYYKIKHYICINKHTKSYIMNLYELDQLIKSITPDSEFYDLLPFYQKMRKDLITKIAENINLELNKA